MRTISTTLATTAEGSLHVERRNAMLGAGIEPAWEYVPRDFKSCIGSKSGALGSYHIVGRRNRAQRKAAGSLPLPLPRS